MQEVTFTLETVTPLFLAGANQEEAELRAPSFRGVLRYWLRALLGGIYGTDTDGLKKVWEEEKKVFGTTDQGSAVMLRLGLGGLGDTKPFAKEQPNPNKPPSGRDYLFWSMEKLGKNGVLRRHYPPGGVFTVTFYQRGGDPAALQRAVAAFWLLVYLGGLGSRSRRGAGSLNVKEVKDWEENLSFTLSETPEALADFLRDGLREVRTLCMPAGISPRRIAQNSAFDVLTPSPEFCRIWVLRGPRRWDTADDALRAIGKQLSDFRTEATEDGRNVWAWAEGEDIGTIEGIIFGVPLQFRSDGQTLFVQGVQGRGRSEKKYDRRASPLSLHITRLSKGQGYVGVAVLFKSRFLPPDARLEIKKNRDAPLLDPPQDYSLIEQWVEQWIKRSFPQPLEVQW